MAINRPEAEEIVARIEKVCADPQYDKKTIGVISLQGDAQARLIDELLIERVGPQVMAERSLVCGDAYAFQGDERHVIFLSMVAAPNARIGALSNAQARRRFNVAGSRAQDQVWLVHSVRPGELSTTDMRRAMLDYYLDPDVEHWEELADFDESIVNPPFESRFEQDVYLRLRERGYRVTPQVRAGGYRIDLVVNGARAKLAVECDGDIWHGSDRWEDDSVRQRRLERADWRFARIRGSDFYRDPDAALQVVWRECERLGIEPGSAVRGEDRTAEPAITGPDHEAGGSRLESFADKTSAVESSLDEVAEPYDSFDSDEEGFEETPDETDEGLDTRGLGSESQMPPGSKAPAQSAEPELRLGTLVLHERLGQGRVTAVTRRRQAGEPWVRIRFADSTFEYTPEEFERAGFHIEPPVGRPQTHRSAPLPQAARGPDSDTDQEPSVAPLVENRPERDPSQLLPYMTWEGDGLPDPREADRSDTASHLLRIIAAEGPITTDRAYTLYVKGAGSSRVTKQARRPLNSALFHLALRVVIDEFENPETNWPQRVVRLPDTPAVVVRELGDRDLYEVPLNEITRLIQPKRGQRPSMTDEDLMRYVLDSYGLVRLTSRALSYLRAAISLLDTEED
jgi:very-short-patch-repair endonuclease